MELRDAALRALYDVQNDLEGPYIGSMLKQLADRIGTAVPGFVDPIPKAGLLSRELSDLVDEGLVLESFEPRIGFEKGLFFSEVRTYRLTGFGYAKAIDIRFTTPTE